MEYYEFLKIKQQTYKPSGFEYPREKLKAFLFEWQKDIILWALRKGKAGIFAWPGMGKTYMELELARIIHEVTGEDFLISAPLTVSYQTKKMAEEYGYNVNLASSWRDVKQGINITNIEKIENFKPERFAGYAPDESSIIKDQASRTRDILTEMFAQTAYKFPATATPSPNDYMELGTHAEFLGVMSRAEMLSTFFVHDGSDTAKWRLKGHAEDKFWEWLAQWACVITNPADLGYEKWVLPPLRIHEHTVKAGIITDGTGQLVFTSDILRQTLNDRRAARRNSLEERTDKAAEIANADHQVLVWCGLNDESEMLTKKIINAVEVRGANTIEHKEQSMIGFSSGDIRCLVTKPSICGWGMNWQNCHEMIFVGLSDSWEEWFQAVRRCWRFGQENPVDVHVVISEHEGAVRQNIERKQRDAERMTREMVQRTKKYIYADMHKTIRMSDTYEAKKEIEFPEWLRSA